MGNFWLKLKVWSKTTLFAVVFIYGLIFILKNSGETVRFWWWFGHEEEHDKLTFGFAAFLGGVILTILVRTTFNTFRQVQNLQSRSRTQRIEKDVQEMKAKAARLQTRSAPGPTTVPGAFEASDPSPEDRAI